MLTGEEYLKIILKFRNDKLTDCQQKRRKIYHYFIKYKDVRDKKDVPLPFKIPRKAFLREVYKLDKLYKPEDAEYVLNHLLKKWELKRSKRNV